MPLPFLYAFIYVYAYMYIYIYNPFLYPHTGLCIYESGGKACQILSVNATLTLHMCLKNREFWSNLCIKFIAV